MTMPRTRISLQRWDDSGARLTNRSENHGGRRGEGKSVKAQYDSTCPCCGEDIVKGDEILRSGEKWVCVVCWHDRPLDRETVRGYTELEDVTPIRPDETRCDRCFTYHRGEC